MSIEVERIATDAPHRSDCAFCAAVPEESPATAGFAVLRVSTAAVPGQEGLRVYTRLCRSHATMLLGEATVEGVLGKPDAPIEALRPKLRLVPPIDPERRRRPEPQGRPHLEVVE